MPIIDKCDAKAILHQALPDPEVEFRDGQWEAIDKLVNHRNKLLLVQRAGWGKSAVYFISTRLLRKQGKGPTLIISPLLSLMRDQVNAAKSFGVRAATINSSNAEEWDQISQQVTANEVDVLLVSPERMGNEDFVDNLLLPISESVGLFVVDEAHCISTWGHDFRPDYQRILNVTRNLPNNIPTLATTATANERTIADIEQQLGTIETLRGSLALDGLALQNLYVSDQESRLAWLAGRIPSLGGSGIIYVLTQRHAEQVAEWLNCCWSKIDPTLLAQPYHAGVEESRESLEYSLLHNKVKVLVATSALGMGFNKPDLGFVIHYHTPDSLTSYYQQIGRAGRLVKGAKAVLLYGGEEDRVIHEYFRANAIPDESHFALILHALEDSQGDGMTLQKLEEHTNLKRSRITKALQLLEVKRNSPIRRKGGTWFRTASPLKLDEISRIASILAQVREVEWSAMLEYANCSDCLMRHLQSALGDLSAKDCNRCSNCSDSNVTESQVDADSRESAANFIRHQVIKVKPRLQIASGELRNSYGLPRDLKGKGLAAEEGRVLAYWGSGEWGRFIQQDKSAGNFRQELVVGLSKLIQERWHPKPTVAWVTCVPSTNSGPLVPNLAKHLARQLNLQFVDAITKARNTDPQKEQENSYHQAKNLAGAFELRANIPSEPVFLVDDVIDSRWTITVVSALLRKQGVKAVFPVALATSSTGELVQ